MPSPTTGSDADGFREKTPMAQFAAAAASIGNIGHISMDLSRACTDLTRFLHTVQKESVERFQIGLRIVERPRQMTIGSMLTEVTFITDADGTLLELMRFIRNTDTDAG